MNSEQSQNIVNKTVSFVKETLKNAESGHGWYHIERVWKLSKVIYEEEMKLDSSQKLDLLIIELSALLHDIADHKFHGGDEKKSAQVTEKFLNELGLDPNKISIITSIINKISFKGSVSANEMDINEGKIVQDADRIDALGAIGIARTFAYGGYKNREIYDPEQPPNLNMNWEQYKNNNSSSINHFYEKLLLLKDRINTQSGKKIAEKRHNVMVDFLNNFMEEWNVSNK